MPQKLLFIALGSLLCMWWYIHAAEPIPMVQMTGSAPVYSYLSPTAPILGMAQNGSRFRVVKTGEIWIQISFMENVGYVERRYTRPFIESTATRVLDNIPSATLFLLGLGILVLICIVFVVSRLASRYVKVKNMTPAGKNCILIAAATKEVTYTLSNTSVPMDTCFKEIGFQVTRVTDPGQIGITLAHGAGDIICADARISENIFSLVITAIQTLENKPLCMFYNVPDPANAKATSNVPSFVHLFGTKLSDRDIFSVVTPLLMQEYVHETHARTVPAGKEHAALQGPITTGSLSEVMQFIDIGKKSGCLLIEQNGPLGMIFFDQAQIVYAATKNFQKIEAVSQMLQLSSGTFRFIVNKMPESRNCNLSTLSVLMEWAQARDENTRH